MNDGTGLKHFWPELEASLDRHRISYLLHYTRPGNIESIISAGGLLSRKRQVERGIRCVESHGWGTKGAVLDDYICFCLEPPMGFLNKGGEWVVLVIDAMVAGLEGACYVSANTARNSVSLDEIHSRSDLLSFEALFPSAYKARVRCRESEVLVPSMVPLRFVGSIILPNRRLWWNAVRYTWKERFRHPLSRKRFPKFRTSWDRDLFAT